MTTTDTVQDWLALLEARYPLATQASWDNSGLQVGDPNWPVARVLVTLDVTPQVLDEAAAVNHTLVVAHHPLVFQPLRSVTPATASGRLALDAATRQIAITAAHTNLDVATDGTNTSMPVARVLNLTNLTSLDRTVATEPDVKLVTFLPKEAVEMVRDALADAGAGIIGAYNRCSFLQPGVGTFRPGEQANPEVDVPLLETAAVEEQRLEMVVPRRQLHACVAALKAHHPYEEVAYDVYERVGPAAGFGMIGDLPEPATVGELATHIAATLPAPDLRVAGPRDRVVSRVAVCGGAGESLIGAALAQGADLYVTGDLKHHGVLDALTLGMSLIDAGHHATEHAALPSVCDALRDDAAHKGLSAAVVASEVNTSPWS